MSYKTDLVPQLNCFTPGQPAARRQDITDSTAGICILVTIAMTSAHSQRVES